MSTKLTQKQEEYAQALFSGLSQRKAYRKAYPKSKKWRDKAVDERASIVAGDTKVVQRLKELNSTAEKETIITHNMIREELAKIAFFDVSEIYDESGNLKDIHSMSDTAKKTITSIKTRTEKGPDGDVSYITEVKLNDKLQATEKLAKHVGFYDADNKQKKTEITIPGLKDIFEND